MNEPLETQIAPAAPTRVLPVGVPEQSRAWHVFHAGWRLVAVVAFGLLIPILLSLQAFSLMQNLDSSIERMSVPNASSLLPLKPERLTPMDYSLAALLFVESSNRAVMVAKQRMKVAVMNVGFAIASVGIMLLMLGIDAGGMNFKFKQEAGFSAEAKITSTGVLVFVIGGLLVGIAGVTPNEFKTASIPGFSATSDPRTLGTAPPSLEPRAAASVAATLTRPPALESASIRRDLDDIKRACVAEFPGDASKSTACFGEAVTMLLEKLPKSESPQHD